MRFAWIAAVLEREVAELLRNRLLVLSILGPPIVIVIGPVVLGKLVAGRPLPPALAASLVADRPAWAALDPGDLAAAYGFQQFLLFFLMLPAFIPLSIATFSIIGEKQSRTLEAVLATPIRTAELLAGKVIAAAVPGIAGGLIAYLGFAGLVGALYGQPLFRIVSGSDWLAATFLLGPAIAVLSVTLGVLVSSRANDPRTAQQVGAVIVVPIVAVVIAQAAGRVLVDATGYGLAAVAVLLIAIAGLRVGSRLFAREAILTQWR